jgi:predicted Zn-dependent protease
MLNETGEGAQHVIITQNALADSSYLDYVRFRYGEQLNTLSAEDSQKGFQDYLADAQKRLLHDQNSPNEPRQIKPGEDIQKSDNRLQVSGQVAVMGINEKLFQTLMAKNPDASFAMEESFPLESVQKNATPLGPIMELGSKGQTENFTQAQAQQSVEQWRGITEQLLADSEITPDSAARGAYAKLLSSQAGLLEQHSFFSEAEQDFKFALVLSPGNTESVFRYVNLLLRQDRTAEAVPVAERALQSDPGNAQFSSLLRQVKTLVH